MKAKISDKNNMMNAKISHRKLRIDIRKTKVTQIETSLKAFDYIQIQKHKIRPNLRIMKISYKRFLSIER